MTWPVAGVVMLIIGVVSIIVTAETPERRRRTCDGCRVEALGSSIPFIAHSCSKGRAHYRNRRGQVYVFGHPKTLVNRWHVIRLSWLSRIGRSRASVSEEVIVTKG